MKTKALFYSIFTICLIFLNIKVALAGDIVWEIFKNKTSYDFSKLKTTDTIPDQIIKLDSLKTIDNATTLDHFSSRIRGYITPTIGGDYTFYFACDNVGQFWLSSDDTEANATLKSEIVSAQTDWNKNISTQTLAAGKKYFFEILHYDSVYTDLIKLGWKIPGTTNPTAIKSTYITTSGDNVPMNKLLFAENTIKAFRNSTFTPNYQILPWNTSNKEIVWSSSSMATIASIDAKGVIYTLNSGECQITGKSAENSSITSTLNLTVINNYGSYFVKANANGKGKSWEDAISLTVLLDLINQSTLFQKINIYVAAGIYKPTNSIDRNKSFIANNVKGIRMLGGYDLLSTGKDTTKRDITKNETILSGDIGIQGESIDNSYHVLTLINSSVIDGFTIRNGRASCSTHGSTPGVSSFKRDDHGGGVYIESQNSNFINCIITDNSSWSTGSGIYSRGINLFSTATVNLQNSTISNNSVQQVAITTGGMFYLSINANGAGISTYYYPTKLNINNCQFYNNVAIGWICRLN